MSFDTTGLTEVKMKTWRGRSGSYYFAPGEETPRAKTCSTCSEVWAVNEYCKNSSNKFSLANECKSCTNTRRIQRDARALADGVTFGQNRHGKMRARYRSRSTAELTEAGWAKRPSGVKRCRECKVEKPLAQFNLSRNTGDGLQADCKECKTILARSRNKNKHIAYWESIGVEITCYLCGAEFEDIEHLIPTSLPHGMRVPSNTRPACRRCNRGPQGKFETPLEEYIFSVNHPTKTRAKILHEIIMSGTWPFSNTTPEEFLEEYKTFEEAECTLR